MLRHITAILALGACLAGQSTVTDRPDGRHLSTRGSVQAMMNRHLPELQFNPGYSPAEFKAWQERMRTEMARIMKHPAKQSAVPVKVKSVKRDGYRVEKWESYPLPESVVPFLVLIPDGADASSPADFAALCIPGFGQTKEMLAGEVGGNYNLEGEPDPKAGKGAMALQYVKQGLVAVAVDNPSFGELSDNGYSDYLTSSRFLLEQGWSYLGLSSWQDRVVLDWMKEQPFINRNRIIASGFSLGTEPMMAIGLLDPEIYAFVYNDFMCRTRERILVMTRPDENGNRAFPNSIEHLIPGFLNQFDFPDIVAALAPRPVICTEGGLDRDFKIIKEAYTKAGAADNFTFHHYEKFKDSSARQNIENLPEGIDMATYFRLCNVDPPHHYFKTEHVIPWLTELRKKITTLSIIRSDVAPKR